LYFLFLFFTTGRYLYRKKDYLNLDSTESRLAGITFYLMIIQIIINFVTGNNFISFWSWLPLAMIHSIINTVELKVSDSNHKISFISIRVGDIYRKYLSNARPPKG
jgi:hypothetical protein